MRDAEPHAPRTYRQLRFSRPPGATEILLVRHGESAHADAARPFPLVAGRGDPELSPEGRAQAERLAERLAGAGVEAVYVTPLRRTLETAAPLLRRLSLTPLVEEDLIEVHMGEWEGGLYRQKITERDPLALRIFAEERWDVIPGAETNASLFARVVAAISRIARRHPDGRVVAVAHAVSIAAVLAHATRSSPFAFVGAENASISGLVVAGDRWTLRRFNDTAHLD